MDQEAWNQIYADLEKHIAARRQRDPEFPELDVIVAIDKARFAMDRGDTDEAIARIQAVQTMLADGGEQTTRSAGRSPALDRLDALEDNLHTTVRLGSARLEIVGEEEEPPTRAASLNTKVNKSIKYDDIRDELLTMWNACKVRSDRLPAVQREADRLIANRKVYEAISAETQVPWWFIGLIHGMECSFSLGKHLHNGDSLKARTWQVPAGRPKEGSPPFTFEQSAIDALNVDGFAGKTDWPLPMVLFRLERYNGFGYRKKFGFASPYLWSYTSHFSSGKYVKDGVFDPNAVSKQCGAGAMLRNLVERGIVSFEEKKPEVVAAPAPVSSPAPAPTPAPVPAPAPTAVPQPPAPTMATAPAPAPSEAPSPASGVPPAPAVAEPAPAPSQQPSTVPAPSAAPNAPAPSPASAQNGVVATLPDTPQLDEPQAAPSGNGVSPAVTAALAELARRPKSPGA